MLESGSNVPAFRESLTEVMPRTDLFREPPAARWHFLMPPVVAGCCFALGLFIGEPMAAFGLAWVRDKMIPAFMELYASGIPFCG